MQAGVCAHCRAGLNARRRDFSEQAWKVLVVWEEIHPQSVDKALCSDCYTELRDVLIERASEIEASLAAHFQPQSRRPSVKRSARMAG